MIRSLSTFRRRLLQWYARHGRELPWRGADAYQVWISEIMLQQTTVAAVKPYFERFLAAFPTVTALAAADEEDVLRLWEGLGYYSRARNLRRAAQLVVREHGGRVPDDVDSLQALPGIGRYTAGAIASFAYDRREPIVEANTLRLHSRLLAYTGDPRSRQGQDALWTFAREVLPRSGAGRFNQALMDLGAMVCTPVVPRCDACPVRSDCAAFAAGLQSEIPRAKPRPRITELTEAAVVVVKGGRCLLRRRGPDEWWTGLWDFPRFEVADDRQAASTKPEVLQRELRTRLCEQTGVSADIGEQLTELRHSVTRYRIRLLCFLAEHQGGRAFPNAGLQWVSIARIGEVPLTMPARKLARQLAARRVSQQISG